MKAEEFEKMKQLDRIEYFLHREKIKESHISLATVFGSLIEVFFMFLMIVQLLMILYLTFDSPPILESLSTIIGIFSDVFKPLVVILLLVWAISWAFKDHNLKKLDRRFKK